MLRSQIVAFRQNALAWLGLQPFFECRSCNAWPRHSGKITGELPAIAFLLTAGLFNLDERGCILISRKKATCMPKRLILFKGTESSSSRHTLLSDSNRYDVLHLDDSK